MKELVAECAKLQRSGTHKGVGWVVDVAVADVSRAIGRALRVSDGAIVRAVAREKAG